MRVIAHIGNVPVEEWLPFLVPVIALYLYGRHRDRRRAEAMRHLPGAEQALDERTVQMVLARWQAADHRGLSAEHVPLLYPPGPEGLTAAELAERTHGELDSVRGALAQLEELGYVELDGSEAPGEQDPHERRAWLTIEGYDLQLVTETALLGAPAPRARAEQRPG